MYRIQGVCLQGKAPGESVAGASDAKSFLVSGGLTATVRGTLR